MDDQESNKALSPKHHWSAVPLFWVTVVIMVLTAILVRQGTRTVTAKKFRKYPPRPDHYCYQIINAAERQHTRATKPRLLAAGKYRLFGAPGQRQCWRVAGRG